ncbi:hypothetical protein CPB83DRAFT_932326 [Crepidotus variabilis]|uniref:Uncharacterized protein n=1 Tax=Crepidotus variabilis TaxID=179855 RepID=A0A9P6BD65_9AGAR|nr:hypothetical protein CPB83DRAFT_932326 [Crepidotus variabilis]
MAASGMITRSTTRRSSPTLHDSPTDRAALVSIMPIRPVLRTYGRHARARRSITADALAQPPPPSEILIRSTSSAARFISFSSIHSTDSVNLLEPSHISTKLSELPAVCHSNPLDQHNEVMLDENNRLRERLRRSNLRTSASMCKTQLKDSMTKTNYRAWQGIAFPFSRCDFNRVIQKLEEDSIPPAQVFTYTCPHCREPFTKSPTPSPEQMSIVQDIHVALKGGYSSMADIDCWTAPALNLNFTGLFLDAR